MPELSTGRSAPSAAGKPTSHVYMSQRLRLHYVDWGKPEASPLLLLHGGRDHGRSWDWIARALRHDHHVVAPDLRGHGDSAWAIGGSYGLADFVADLDQLVHQKQLAPVSIIAHSLGGAVSLLYAGLFPEAVRRLVVLEGTWQLDPALTTRSQRPVEQRVTGWIEQLRALAVRTPRGCGTLEEAVARMRQANPHLSIDQARQLTVHGTRRNEDGTLGWTFDPYVRTLAPNRFSTAEVIALWSRLIGPVLLLHGATSPHADPQTLGLLPHFQNARAVTIADAGHWLHHDRLEEVLAVARPFLADTEIGVTAD